MASPIAPARMPPTPFPRGGATAEADGDLVGVVAGEGQGVAGRHDDDGSEGLGRGTAGCVAV